VVYGAGEPTGEAHARMKTAMKWAGVIEHDYVRAPTHRPSAEEEADIRRVVEAAGLSR
jgi:4-hydroxy-tetrahydrodipicolinate synthase